MCKSNLKKIFVVFKTHYDIGYTCLVEELLHDFSNKTIKKVLDSCESTNTKPKSKRFVWTMQAWPLMQTILGIEDPKLKKRVEDSIANNQILWLNTPFTTHTEFFGVEDFIRGLYFSRKLSKEYGVWPKDAKMTDVPGHTWMLPSILAKAGVKFLHLGCNPSSMPADVPSMFFWEGPDGNRVLTYYSKGGYGTGLLPPEDWNYPFWLAMLQTGDNLGPQGAEYIDEIIEVVKRDIPGVEVSIGSLSDFGNAILESGIDVPVIRGDLADTWIKGVGSAPKGVSLIREIRSTTASMENILALNKLLNLYKNTVELDNDLKCLFGSYENMSLFGEHTWGMDCKITALNERYFGAPWDGREYEKHKIKELKLKNKGYIKLQKSWDEQLDFLKSAEKGLEKFRNSSLNLIADNINIDGERIVVFNSLGWQRDSSIKLSIPNRESEKITGILDTETDEQFDISLNLEGDVEVAIKGLPALGYKSYKVLRNNNFKAKHTNCSAQSSISYHKETMGVLDNCYFRIEVDSISGAIKGIYDKQNEKQWVDSYSEFSFAQYIYDIYGYNELEKYLFGYCYNISDWYMNDFGKMGYPRDQKHERFTYSNFEISCENGGNWGSVTISKNISDKSTKEYGNGSNIALTVKLYTDKPYIDIEFKLFNKEESAFIESGYLAFPLNIKNPKYSINKLGAVIDPVKDILADCNKDLLCCENWVDISGEGCGITIIPISMPLFSIDTPDVLSFDRNREINSASIFFHAFNNSWGTNFPQWIGGDHTFKYRLVPHSGNHIQGESWKKAYETMREPIVSYSKGNVGSNTLPFSLDLLKHDLDGLSILAFKPAEEGNGFILRLNETKGISRKAEIRLNTLVKKAYCCNIVEMDLKEIALANQEDYKAIKFDTGAFEIHTFYIEL